MMGIVTDFDLYRIRQGMFVPDGFTKQVNLLSDSLLKVTHVS